MSIPSLRGLALATLCVYFLLPNCEASAQHSDIAFGYLDNKIAVAFGTEGRVFEGNFSTSGSFEQTTDNPGFATYAAITPDHIIDYKILGPLAYHNGTSFATVPSGANIQIIANPSTAGPFTVDATTIGPISGPGAIAQADFTGGVHSHIDFELGPLSLDTPEYGAYSLLMSLASFELDGTTPTEIADSDPFYMVFNFGLETVQFEQAVSDFAAQVPEPSSLALLGFTAITLLHRHRSR